MKNNAGYVLAPRVGRKGNSLSCPHASRQKRKGFTLVELMMVMVIIGILMASMGMAVSKARELARRARAETELREMVAAWLQFHQLYEAFPSTVKGRVNIDTTRTMLEPLMTGTTTEGVSREIALLNPKLPFNANDFYVDPWGTPYQLSFSHTEELDSTTAMETSVTFPGRQRRFP